MIQKFQVSPLLGQRLRDLGHSVVAVLHTAGLPPNLFEQPRIQLSTTELFALWRAIGEITGDPIIGLRLGREERIERYDPVAIAGLCARDLADSLARLARYKRLTCPEIIDVTRRGDEWLVRFIWSEADTPEPDELLDVCFAWLLTIARRATADQIDPARVELRRSPRSTEEMERFYRAPIHFRAKENCLVFRASDMSRPFSTHNQELLAAIVPSLENELARRVEAEALPEKVRQILKKRMAGKRPSLQDVGRELHMSPRTLQRRLTEGGISFQMLVQEARHELARNYLANSPLDLTETAYLLGFEDTNSFVRAFHSWEGLPPGEWRSRKSRFGSGSAECLQTAAQNGSGW